MLQEKDISYKNLDFKINSELNCLEVLIDDINFSDQKSYIYSVSILLEFALTVNPRYLILNKLNSKFKIKPELYPFTSNNILNPLKNNGVKKIICMATEEEIQNHYKKIELEEPFIKALPSKDEVINWITENS
jgi:hypothetical protein